MNSSIVFQQKNLLFNANFIQDLQVKLKAQAKEGLSSEDILVTIFINGGSHPMGKYIIPVEALVDFIKQKTTLQCWRDYGYWTQSNVPVKLRPYFNKM